MQIAFILVEPATPENIGSAARAIKTMGFPRLILVRPCNHLSNPARWLAHASNDILESAQVFDSFKTAITGFDFIIGTTAKKRSVKNDYFQLEGLPQLLKEKGHTVTKVAVVFGREESGLTNEELKQCHLVTTVPLKTTYPSLNLAQAVMLYAYELAKINYSEIPATPEINTNSFAALHQKVSSILLDAGFKENTNIFPRFLERLNFLSEDDIHLLHSYCNKILQNKK
jgi:tRNA/rRNA methyltransferase